MGAFLRVKALHRELLFPIRCANPALPMKEKNDGDATVVVRAFDGNATRDRYARIRDALKEAYPELSGTIGFEVIPAPAYHAVASDYAAEA